jgi:hypothetical protein
LFLQTAITPQGVPSMKVLSSTCIAIALASKAGTLNLVERTSRFGDTFIAIEDDHGIIEVADNMLAAQNRLLQLAA